ncbi:MAG: HAD-IA family hydrolase [Verrucomicrobiota bacterium]
MKISTIIFDIGRTLLHFDFSVTLKKVSENSDLSLEQIEEVAFGINEAIHKERVGIIDQYELGQISSEEFFSSMKEMFHFHGSLEDLEGYWCDIFTPLEDHIQYARQLAQYYPMAVLSNTSEAHIQHFERDYEFFSIFRQRFYSCRMSLAKPDAKIYEQTIAEMGADRFETLLIDDREENVLGAMQQGWQTIHLRPEVDLKLALQSYELTGI